MEDTRTSELFNGKTAHTPGPWRFQDHKYTTARIIAVGPHRHLEVAAVYATDFDAGEANGHLITAAPDLLAACQAIVAEEDRMIRTGDVITTQGEIIDRLLRPAIAKATGGAK